MANLVLPRVQAMVLCDHIEASIQESEVFNLHGVRGIIEASSFPFTRPRLCIYVQMSGHEGEASCYVRIHRPETDETIYRTPSREIWFEDPLTVVSAIFRLRNCSFPSAGIYYAQLLNEHKLIGERTLHLLEEG